MSLHRFALGFFLFLALSPSAYTQGNEVVIHSRPLHVRHFSGVIVDQTGMWVEYATVELHDPRSHRVLASTFADGKGFFYFDDKKYGKRIEIRAFKHGFNASQYIAMRRPFGDNQMQVVLQAGN